MENTAPDDRGPLAIVLIALREAIGVSQRRLAEVSGVSASTIRDIETGRQTKPRWDTLRMLAEGVSLGISGKPDPQRTSAAYQALLRAAGHHDLARRSPQSTVEEWFDYLLDPQADDSLEAPELSQTIRNHWRLTTLSARIATHLDSISFEEQEMILGILSTIAERLVPGGFLPIAEDYIRARRAHRLSGESATTETFPGQFDREAVGASGGVEVSSQSRGHRHYRQLFPEDEAAFLPNQNTGDDAWSFREALRGRIPDQDIDDLAEKYEKGPTVDQRAAVRAILETAKAPMDTPTNPQVSESESPPWSLEDTLRASGMDEEHVRRGLDAGHGMPEASQRAFAAGWIRAWQRSVTKSQSQARRPA